MWVVLYNVIHSITIQTHVVQITLAAYMANKDMYKNCQISAFNSVTVHITHSSNTAQLSINDVTAACVGLYME